MPFVLLISVIGIISVYLFRIFQFRKIFNVRYPSIYTYMPKRFFFSIQYKVYLRCYFDSFPK